MLRSTYIYIYSLQEIPTQHDMLPQYLIYKNELNREYVITLARNDETPWWWSEKIETCRSGFKCFKWKLYRCICWLIVEVILRNARFNDEIKTIQHLVGFICSSCITMSDINNIKEDVSMLESYNITHSMTKPPTLKAPFCPEIPDTSRYSSGLFVGSDASPICPSNKSNIKMTINTEHWWDDTYRENRRARSGTCLTTTLSTSLINTCPGRNPRLCHENRVT